MIQPYTGLWEIPKEGILLYNQYTQEASVLNDEYTFELELRKEGLSQLSPIKLGWAVIGRPDKYLPASGYKMLHIDETTIKIKMVEDAQLMLWSKVKTVLSENFVFTKMDNGLWQGELTKPTKNNEYTIVGL